MKTFLLSILLLPLFSFAQHEVLVGELLLRYEVIEDSVFCFMTAPTRGWIMMGFNHKNSLSGADFKFFSVENGQAIYSDQKNIGGRKYLPDQKLNGSNNITLHSAIEKKNRTSISFSIPLKSNDPNDYQHDTKTTFWLILAYSAEDDFKHHSLFRKHLPFQWEP